MIPKHVAIIMDGNRRWAKEHGVSVLEGHKRVAQDILEPLVEAAAKRNIEYITFWAWSTENWKRKQEEVSGIMNLFKTVVHHSFRSLHKKGVRVKVIGDISAFEKDIREQLEKVVKETEQNTVITVVFALNYGGRDEIIRAFHTWERTHTEPLTKESFSGYLDTKGIPDPDLIIRTGGEQRLSGFLLWQSEYSELYFPSWYMPDFTEEKLDEALAEYAHRKRNFGV